MPALTRLSGCGRSAVCWRRDDRRSRDAFAARGDDYRRLRRRWSRHSDCLRAAGACIGLLARGGAGLEGALQDVASAGGRGVICQADVADADAVENAARTLESTFGPIDVWINNAMASVFSPVHEMDTAEFKRVTEVTYLGTVHGTLAALRRMRPRDRGVIIQVGSALAYRGIPLQSAYCAAKHAVQGFCESLRAELLHDEVRIRLTIVQLPALNTPHSTG